ncbi:tail completion protein gp17 [Sphingobium limneticum]|uniref:tail completion protein gp17 n=1 Tax=Sphingobium limneticum TaxID=1007511 RepID=UPI003CFDCE47
MNFHEGVTARLLRSDPVTAIAGQRLSWGLRPQGEPLPGLTLQVVSDPRPSHLKGPDGARYTRLQADCWGETAAQALALAKAVIETLQPPTTIDGKKFGAGRVDAQRDLGESVGSGNASQSSGTYIHRQSVDFIIRHVGD